MPFLEILNNNLLFLTNILAAALCTLLCFRCGVLTLVSWIAAQGILANLFVLKQIELFGMNVTASDVFTISGMFSILLLEEFYSKDYAKKAIIASCVVLVFFAAVSQLHLAYTPSEADFAQSAYQMLFGPNFRIILASIIAYWVSQQCSVFIYRFTKTTKLPLQLRFIFAITIAQFIDTVGFAYMGLYGIITHLHEIILFSFTVKVITLLLLTNLSHLIRRLKTPPPPEHL